jgi:O-antigen ligase
VYTAPTHRRDLPVAEGAVAMVAVAFALLVGVLAAQYSVAGVFVVLGVAFGLVVLRWPFIGLLVFASSIAVENLLVIEGAAGAATGSRLLGLLVFGAWLIGKLLRRETMIPVLTSALMLLGLLLFTFALTSALWARVPQAALSGAVQLTQFIALGAMTFDLARSWDRVDLLLKALVVGATVAALLTIQQAVSGEVRRAGGDISGGINATAVVLVTILPFAFYLLRSQASAAWRVLGVTYIAIAATATIVTYSRMNLLVLPILLVLLSFHSLLGRRGRGPILFGAAAALGVAFYVVPIDRLEARLVTIVPYLQGTATADDSGVIEPSARGYHLRIGFAIARDEPVIGAGFRNYGYLFRDEYQFVVPGPGRVYSSVRSPHSSHVGMLADLGIIGFSLWIALLFRAGLIPAARTWRRTASDRNGTPYLASQAITYALGVQVLAYGWYTTNDRDKLLWILLGLATAAWGLARTSTPDSEQAPRHSSLY